MLEPRGGIASRSQRQTPGMPCSTHVANLCESAWDELCVEAWPEGHRHDGHGGGGGQSPGRLRFLFARESGHGETDFGQELRESFVPSQWQP